MFVYFEKIHSQLCTLTVSPISFDKNSCKPAHSTSLAKVGSTVALAR